MFHCVRAGIFTASALALVGLTLGCDESPPSPRPTPLEQPVPQPQPQPPTVDTLTPSRTTVLAGDQLSVSWTVTRSGGSDWIGFFKVGEPSTNYESRWWMYTYGVTSGTLTLSAGSETGQFEFRFLLDDGYVELIRSSQVTVIPR